MPTAVPVPEDATAAASMGRLPDGSGDSTAGPAGPPQVKRSVSLGMPGTQRLKVSVRVNQPVEGVPLEPFVFVRDEKGNMLGADDARVSFTWMRSSEMWRCSCYQCRVGRGCVTHESGTKHPVQCTDCARAKKPVAPSLFCCAKCMGQCWAAHKCSRHKDSAAAAGAGGAGLGSGSGSGSGAGDEHKKEAPRLGGSPDDDEDERLIAGIDDLPPVERTTAGWTQVGTSRAYVPTVHDVGHKLRVRVTATFGGGITKSEKVDSKFVQAVAPPPPVRPLVSRPTVPPNVKVVDNALGFRIVTYNVLAEIYATQSQYPYCPLWALRFNYRRNLLLEELTRYDPDIICLQEVQTDQFNSFLYHELLSRGYEGLYKQKTRASMGQEGKVDGCALFYRKSRFTLSEKYVIEFNDAAEAMYNGKNKSLPQHQRDVLLKRLKRGNVAQVVVLEMTSGPKGEPLQRQFRICVANTHLSWNPEYDDVKLWQVHMLVKELEKFIVSRHLPLVLCGDFNSDPDSSVYKLLSSNRDGTTHFPGMAPEDLPRDPCHILRGKISHNLVLDSAFRSFDGAEPEFTNYTGDFVGCLDYAWTTTDTLLVKSVAQLPTAETLSAFAHTALPNPQFPSDHVALVFDMVSITTSRGARTPMTFSTGSGSAAIPPRPPPSTSWS